jgi:hypothetical protein
MVLYLKMFDIFSYCTFSFLVITELFPFSVFCGDGRGSNDLPAREEVNSQKYEAGDMIRLQQILLAPYREFFFSHVVE